MIVVAIVVSVYSKCVVCSVNHYLCVSTSNTVYCITKVLLLVLYCIAGKLQGIRKFYGLGLALNFDHRP